MRCGRCKRGVVWLITDAKVWLLYDLNPRLRRYLTRIGGPSETTVERAEANLCQSAVALHPCFRQRASA